MVKIDGNIQGVNPLKPSSSYNIGDLKVLVDRGLKIARNVIREGYPEALQNTDK